MFLRVPLRLAVALLAAALLQAQTPGPQLPSPGGGAPRRLQKMALLEGLNSRSERRWQMEWDATRQSVRQLHSGLTPTAVPAGTGPVERARRFLQETSEILDLFPDVALTTVEARPTLAGSLVRFRRQVNGIAVEESMVSVHLTTEGKVYWVNKQASATLPAAGRRVLIAEDAARGEALIDLRPDLSSLRAPVQSELVLKENGGVLRYTWRVDVAANKPLGDWRYWIDAESGALMGKENLLLFARARIFNPNPLVTLKDPTLRDPLARDTGMTRTTADANCDPGAVPSKAYQEVDLLGLAGTGMLDGEYVNTGLSGPASDRARANPDFLYVRCDSRFNEVMAYAIIDSVQRYLQSLGLRNVNNRSISVNANGFIDFGRTQDQSFYSPLGKELVFGLGGVHDAEDGEIIAHEYGHAIQDNQAGFPRSSVESQSIGEGFGDILAALYFTPFSGGFADALVGEWDATFYDKANPIPRLRPVESAKTFSDFEPSGDVHRNGTIWAAAIWDFYTRLGATRTARDTALRLLIESQFLYSPNATFAEAARALIQTDERITGGANGNLLTTIFIERRILPTDSKLPPPQLVESEPNGEPIQAQALTESQHIIAGEIRLREDVDYYRIHVKPNQLWAIEVYAKRLISGSSLDSLLTLLDTEGKPPRFANGAPSENDDISRTQQDSRVVFATTAEADLFVKVASYGSETSGPYVLLIYPVSNPLRVPRVVSGPGSFTGVALSNAGPTEAIVGLILMDDSGRAVSTLADGNRTVNIDNPRMISIPAGQQVAFLDSDIFGYQVPASGWLEIHSTSAEVKGYFLSGTSTTLLGAEASGRSHQDGIFPLAAARAASATFTSTLLDTEFNLVNPNGSSATVELTVFDNLGRAAFTQQASIEPFGRLRRTLSTTPGIPPLAGGYARVRSDRPLAGFELNGDQRQTGLSLRATDESAATLWLPHFAEAPAGANGRLFTILNLVNPTARRIRVTVAPLADSGAPFAGLPAPDLILEAGTSQEVALRALLGITDLTRTYTGSLQLRADGTGLLAVVRYARTDIAYMAALALDPVPRRRMIFSHVADGTVGGVQYLTGVALQNGGSETASVALRVYGPDGTLRGQLNPLNPASLQPGQRLVRLLSELVPNLPAMAGGYVVVEGTAPLFGFELIGQADNLIPVGPQ